VNAQNSLKLVAALCFVSLGLAAYGQTSPADVPSPTKAAPSTQAKVHYGQLPLSFEPNRGQTSSDVQWLARGPQYTLYLAGADAVLQMNKITPAKRDSADPKELQPTISSSAVRMNLLGASFRQTAIGDEPQSGKANYFTGNDPAKWQHDVPMYGKVRMNGVYPGVDLVYYGHQGALEYDFVVAPGADASAIKLSFDGSKATLAENGDLVLPVEGGPEVRFNKPVVYQMVDGVRRPVDGSFAIAAVNHQQQVSFQLGAYDHSRELVIDPTLLFLGIFGTGNYETQAIGMAVDASGEIILTGETSDVNLPVTTGAYQTTCNQDSAVATAHNYVRCGGSAEGYLGSAFITKISADGTSLVYSTYLHGFSGSELGQAVAVDAAGDAIILGQTGSSDFPVTADAIQPLCMPYYYPIGVAGGSPADFYQPAAQHCDGYFAGGGTEWVSGGPTLFVAKLDPTGANLLYSTFFGGTQPTFPNSLALDSAGNIYFTSYLQSQGGQTASNYYPQNGNVPFPVTANALQTQNEAVQMATLSVLSADGQTLLYSTLFGATNTPNPAWVQPLALAVGPNGMAYVGGETYSDAIPTTAGSVRPGCVTWGSYNNQPDNGYCEAYTGWLAAFNTLQSGQNSLQYGTYIGGPEVPFTNPNNVVYGLAADSDNNVYVTGNTYLTTYPTTTGAYQTACLQLHGSVGQNYCSQTAFLTKINPTGTGYVWSTLFEGNQQSNDYGQNIGLDSVGNVYLYGWDSNYTFDLPWVNPLEGRPGSSTGASYPFLATFSPDGSKLLFSTPLGNTNAVAGNDYPVGMVLDSANNIYFAGYAADNTAFATSPGAYVTPQLGGGIRTYFGKISPLMATSATTLTIAPTTAAIGQTVTFTATVAGTTQATPAPTGTVTLTNTSTNPATTVGAITLTNGTGTFTSSSLAVGTYSVTASYSGDSTYDVSTSAAQSLNITIGSQTITFTGLPATATYGSAGPYTLNGAASSGLAVSYGVTGPASISGSTLTITGTGLVTVTASQAGNGNYSPATSVSQSINVSAATQTITFTGLPATATYGAAGPYTLNGTASSGLAVSYGVTGPASISGSTLTITGTGLVTVTASQAGSGNYSPATSVSQSINVSAATQTITFTGLPATATYGAAGPYTLNGTASSGLTVSYGVSGPASISGSTLTITGAGTVTVTASQAGNANYGAATAVSQTILVSKASQTISFTGLPATATYGAAGPYTLNGTASSGLAVSYGVTGPASISGSTLTITGAGTVTVTASQAGNANYSAATPVSQTIQVGKASQTITFNGIPAQTVGTPVSLTATASSGLAVSFASLTSSVCTVSGNTATLILAGTCTIQASQPGNSNFAAAASVSQSFSVTSTQTASFTITPIPAVETVNRGELGVFILELKSVKGFNGNVKLTCTGGPTGNECVDFPQTVKVNGTAFAISGILFQPKAKPGTYTITFTGVSGSITESATAQFIVK